MASTVTVEAVTTARDRERFLRLPWRIYRGDPAWVAPLLSDQRKLLDPRRHPFHRHAEVALFLARAGGEVVGRIAAVVNRAHNEFHDERTAHFGLFESVDDQAVAGALLRVAEAWAGERGMDRLVGPMNLSTNDEAFSPGFLVEGYETPPQILMGHQPPYYATLAEAAGYVKEKDLLAYWVDSAPVQRLERSAERVLERAGVTLRPLDAGRLEEEVAAIQSVYNDAWERNWGFVPMTDAEFERLARELRPIIDPRLCAIAESGDGAVGFLLALPDYNQALRHVDGRLFPFGLLKLLWYRRKIDAVRVITLGLRPGYRKRGLDAMLILQVWRLAAAAGRGRGECSWVLEDNLDMIRALERIGGRAYKRYRVYARSLQR